LTSGDLDGVLGLLLLREFQPLRVYATRSVRQILSANSIFAMLQREKPQATWCDITPGQYFEINGGDVRCLPISVAASFPEYVDGNTLGSLSPGEAVIALGIRSSATQHGLLFAPSVGQGNQPLLDEATRYDVVLWDGTFWSDDELIAVRGHGKKATEMGHLPLSGPQGALSSFPASQQQRLFIHINNTNPILDEGGQEYARIRAAGWEAAADGMELIL
jgi:pyrroloquinoline quinone biosynthesis protein B